MKDELPSKLEIEELISNLTKVKTFWNHWKKARSCNILVDKDGFVLTANERMCSVLGYSHDELINKLFMDFVHLEDKQSTLDIFETISNSNSIDRFVNRYITKQKHIVVFMWTAVQIDNNISAVATIIQPCMTMNELVCFCQYNTNESCYRNELNNIILNTFK